MHRSEEKMTNHIMSSRKLTRSMLPTYNMNMCIVCQEKTEESLHQIMSDACDNQLRNAFQVAPFTLAPL